MKLSINKLTLMAILTAIALIIFMVEALIPLPISVPGVKLGLANTVTLFALFYRGDGSFALFKQKNKAEEPSPCFSAYNVLAILLCRIVLGAVFTGRPIVVVYSMTGGLFAFGAMLLIKRFVSEKQIWVCGAIGAIFHNIGQILAAILLTGTHAITAYLPILTITAIITGTTTGLIAQLTLKRISDI